MQTTRLPIPDHATSLHDEPVAKLFSTAVYDGHPDAWLRRSIEAAYRLRASDLHFEPFERGVRTRTRVEGRLMQTQSVTRVTYDALLSAIKVRALLDVTRRDVAQDGAFQLTTDDTAHDIRVSVVPALYGEKMVFRFIRPDAVLRTLPELGLLEDQERILRAFAAQSSGLAIITGATGSGKTTTGFAMLNLIDRCSRNVVTVEDPIEYRLPWLTQVPVGDAHQVPFHTALRALLRQDPDVIYVGEIRDAETAQLTFQAASTGHLVLSTLHADGAVQIKNRLCDLGISIQRQQDEITLLTSQKLLTPPIKPLEPMANGSGMLSHRAHPRVPPRRLSFEIIRAVGIQAMLVLLIATLLPYVTLAQGASRGDTSERDVSYDVFDVDVDQFLLALAREYTFGLTLTAPTHARYSGHRVAQPLHATIEHICDRAAITCSRDSLGTWIVSPPPIGPDGNLEIVPIGADSLYIDLDGHPWIKVAQMLGDTQGETWMTTPAMAQDHPPAFKGKLARSDVSRWLAAQSVQIDTLSPRLLKLYSEDNASSRQDEGRSGDRLFRVDLSFISSDLALTYLAPLATGCTLSAAPGGNAILVSSVQSSCADVPSYVTMIDVPIPQVLIEVMVLEIGEDLQRAFSVQFETTESASQAVVEESSVSITQSGTSIRSSLGRLTGSPLVGFPTGWRVSLQALAEQGDLRIVTRPQLATLSGQTARMEMGTTQYYILTNTVPYASVSDVYTQESQRFETISANVSLEVTPWVHPGGDVTVRIKPEFSTPVGTLTPGIPPTINSRTVTTTVRVKDGETIVIGGLTSTEEEQRKAGWPLFQHVPLLRRLARNMATQRRNRELILYITPHIVV